MNNTVQIEKKNISKINISAIFEINNFIKSSCNQKEKSSNEKDFVNIENVGK